LFAFGNVAAIAAGVEALLRANPTVFCPKIDGLMSRQFTFSALDSNPVILIVQARVDFDTARMMRTPTGCVRARGYPYTGNRDCQADKKRTIHLQLHRLRGANIGSLATNYPDQSEPFCKAVFILRSASAERAAIFPRHTKLR
jgi:hypothetical protein